MQLSGMQLSGLTGTLYMVSWSTIHFLRVDSQLQSADAVVSLFVDAK